MLRMQVIQFISVVCAMVVTNPYILHAIVSVHTKLTIPQAYLTKFVPQPTQKLLELFQHPQGLSLILHTENTSRNFSHKITLERKAYVSVTESVCSRDSISVILEIMQTVSKRCHNIME